MKQHLLITFLFLFSSGTALFAQKIQIPLKFEKGYGDFSSAMAGIGGRSDNADNPWYKTNLKTRNLPSWTDITEGLININIYQFAYQNYHQGKISEEFYNKLNKSWNWNPDSSQLSSNPIRCYIAFAYGKDNNGEDWFILDTNNNLDFGDDIAFQLSSVNDTSVSFEYDVLEKDKVVTKTAELDIKYSPEDKKYFAKFASYATVELDGHKYAIVSSEFINLSYFNINVIPLDNHISGTKIETSQYPGKGQYLSTDNNVWKIEDIDINKKVLLLEEVSKNSKIEASQIGFYAPRFSGEEFTTGQEISIDSYRGKYLYIDFWAVWCAPCIEEMPTLNELYAKIDRSKIEFLGIVGDSPRNNIKSTIAKHSIKWPVIESTDSNSITGLYSVMSYPSSFLIDPEGVIIDVNLRGDDLKNKLDELLK